MLYFVYFIVKIQNTWTLRKM